MLGCEADARVSDGGDGLAPGTRDVYPFWVMKRNLTQRTGKRLSGSKRSWGARLLVRVVLALALIPVGWALALFVMRWVDPPFTGVQVQRRVESWFATGRYQKRYEPVDTKKISVHLRHAVVAAEDGRFAQHFGIDWEAVGTVAMGKSMRGASTLTQQLVKNLFFTTHRNPLRKLAEFGLAPAAEMVLRKERILELYLNSVEWGPGVFGAEAAARYHYKIPASALSREQAARLAACLPSPRKRRPGAMNQYSAVILARMEQMGW